MVLLLLIVTIWGLPSGSAGAQDSPDRIGLHVTQAELEVWRARAQNGPFKDGGDAGYRTPNDWNEIASNTSDFMGNPSADRFTTGESGCVERGSDPTLMLRRNLRDAAFYSLVKDDASVRNEVLKELLWQANESSTDFSDRSIWCTEPPESLGGDLAFVYAEWMTRLLFAYDYIRPSVSSGDRSTLDRWFQDAGTYFRENVDRELEKLFDDRAAGVLSSYGTAQVNDEDPDELTHHGGWQIATFHKWWNNRRSAQMRFVGLAGIQQNDDALIESAKQWVKDVLKYGTFPDGVPAEYHRSHGYKASKGWGYATVTISHMAELANHLARAGDEELLQYSTSDGAGATAGGDKTIRLAVNHIFGTMDGSLTLYNKTGREGDSDALLDGFVASQNKFYAYDIWFAFANNYWDDSALRSKYMELGPEHRDPEGRGSEVKNIGPFMPWGGSGDVYPGMMFMFAGMEDQVDPYPNSRSSSGTTQRIPLSAGWNSVGTSVALNDPSLDAVLAEIGANLALMKDENGDTYIPSEGIDTLDRWEVEEGYLLYVERADTLVMEGESLDPATTEIALSEGWNVVPYIPTTAMSVSAALADISSALVLLKDGDGNAYLPAYGIDDVGTLEPRQAYLVYVDRPVTLTYP